MTHLEINLCLDSEHIWLLLLLIAFSNAVGKITPICFWDRVMQLEEMKIAQYGKLSKHLCV
jgi:hypothetical protein